MNRARFIGGPLHGKVVYQGRTRWCRYRDDQGRRADPDPAFRYLRAGTTGYALHRRPDGECVYLHATRFPQPPWRDEEDPLGAP